MVAWITANWVQIGVGLWAVDQLLKVIGGLTGIKMIDNLADGLGNILGQFFKGQQPPKV